MFDLLTLKKDGFMIQKILFDLPTLTNKVWSNDLKEERLIIWPSKIMFDLMTLKKVWSFDLQKECSIFSP